MVRLHPQPLNHQVRLEVLRSVKMVVRYSDLSDLSEQIAGASVVKSFG